MTGGYLLAYPIMAWLLSMVCERPAAMGSVWLGWHWQTCAVTCWAPPGSWLPTGMGLWASLSACVIPFILPDLAKGWCALWLAERLR